jgi:hypothetical protein
MRAILRPITNTFLLFTILFQVFGMFLFMPRVAEAQGVVQTDTVRQAVTLGNTNIQGRENGDTWSSRILGWILRPLGWVFRFIGALFMSMGGFLMTAAIEYSINFPINAVTGLQIGWTVMRDFANLFFIFIILWIAIKTILQMEGHSTKKMLVNVIVVALLINFSGFLTKVIIDFGNVVAVGFYNTILDSNAPGSTTPVCAEAQGSAQPDRPCTIDKRISAIVGVNNLVNATSGITSPMQITLIYLLSGLLLFALGAVFFKATFYFVARTVAFALLYVFSPIAFIAYVFPSSTVQRFSSSWWGKLWGYTLLAPAFMIVMYLVLQILTQGGLTAPNGEYAQQILLFFIIIGLVWVGTGKAFDLADGMGSGVASWGSKMAAGVGLGVAAGGVGLIGRQTLGRYSASKADLSQNARLKEDMQKSGFRGAFARLRYQAYDKGAKGSWDVAQSKYGAKGASTLGADIPGFLQQEGGFKKSGRIEHTVLNRGKLTKAQEEDYAKKAKELFPDDPIAQQNYLRNNMGFQGYKKDEDGQYALDDEGNRVRNDNFDSAKNKDVKEIDKKANEKIRTKAEKAGLEADVKKMENETDEEARKTLEASIRARMKKLGVKAVAGLDEDVLLAIAPYLSSSHLQTIHQANDAGEYEDATLLTKIGASIMDQQRHGTKTDTDTLERAKEYLTSPEGQQKLFNYNVPESERTRTQKYRSGLENTQKALARSDEEYTSAMETIAGVTEEHVAEVQHMREDLERMTSDMADIRTEHKDEDAWAPEESKKIKELADKIRTKRREMERAMEKHADGKASSAKNKRLQELQKQYKELQGSNSLDVIRERNRIGEEINRLNT